MSKVHWAKQAESGSYLGIRTLLWFYRFGGKWLLQVVLVPVLLYFVCINQRARQASRQFLQRVHATAAEHSSFRSEPGLWQIFLHFYSFAYEALAKIDGWLGRIGPERLNTIGNITFDDIVRQQKGGVLIGSHLGNVELSRAMASRKYSTRIHVLVFTRHAVAFNKALQQTNHMVETNMVQVDTITPALAIQMREWIDNNEFIVIVGDRMSVSTPEQAIWCDFLGHPAPFAIGPWVLASVLECPVYLLFCLRQGDHYALTLQHFSDQIVLPRKQRQQALQQYVSAYAAVLQGFALLYPYQWFNFFDFWHLPEAGKDK
ncbi:MAG: acetyltransferase [Rheinheimera sp.]|nr:MAG: acetyltransferase [Rheinheimera sp.]